MLKLLFPFEGRDGGGLKEFIEKVGKFQVVWFNKWKAISAKFRGDNRPLK